MPSYSVNNTTASDVPISAGNFSATFPANSSRVAVVDDVDADAFIAAVIAAGLVALPYAGIGAGNAGSVAEAVCRLAVRPTAGDLILVGVTNYKFVEALGAVTAQPQVVIGASGAWRANLGNAFNNDAISRETTWREATTPGAERIVATTGSSLGGVLVANADARGGNPILGRQAITLGQTLTAGAGDGWNIAGLSASGTPPGSITMAQLLIGPRQITAGFTCFSLPFHARSVWMLAYTSAGILRNTTDTVSAIDGGKRVKVSLAGGAAPAVQFGDTVVVQAIG